MCETAFSNDLISRVLHVLASDVGDVQTPSQVTCVLSFSPGILPDPVTLKMVPAVQFLHQNVVSSAEQHGDDVTFSGIIPLCQFVEVLL